MNTAPLSGTQGNQEVTKQNQPYAKPEPDAFDSVLRTAEFGTRRRSTKILEEDLEKLWRQESEPIPNWLRPDKEKVELPESPFDTIKWLDEEPVPIKQDTVEGECNLAVHIPPYLRPINLSARDEFLKAGIGQLPDWLEDDDGIGDLPSWLTASGDDDLFAKNGLPKASRNRIPDWMTERDPVQVEPDIDLSEFRWDPDAVVKKDKEKFDPNKTQEVKTVKREEPKPEQKAPSKTRINLTSLSKQKKALLGLGAIGLYLFVFNLIGWAIPTGIDNIIIDVLGIYVYTTLADNGYDVRNLLPRKRK